MCADYDSHFETESESEVNRKSKRKELIPKESLGPNKKSNKGVKSQLVEEFNKEERKRRINFQSLDAYSRHKMLVNEYLLSYSGSTSKLVRNTSKDKTEYEVLRDNHKFIWNEDEDEEVLSWGQRIAKKYYDHLFKEYCISDMSRYKENKFGMRWRTEEEVVSGKGQFSCGAKHCSQTDALKSWEVLFTYVEFGKKKSALVKLRLCDECSHKLNYRQKRREIKYKNKSNAFNSQLESQKSNHKVHHKSGEVDSDNSKDNVMSNDNTESAMSSSSGEIWSKPQKIPELEKPIDDEFDEYFSDLLL